jgi:hypothetical protein
LGAATAPRVKVPGVETREISDESNPGANLEIGGCVPTVHVIWSHQTEVGVQIQVAAKDLNMVFRLGQGETSA